MTPTARTTERLEALGWTVGLVERWIARAKVRVDLFGGIDLIAIRGQETLGVQATTNDNATARLKKIVEIQQLRLWVEGGRRLEIWGWRKLATRDAEGKWWQPRIIEVTAEMFV